MIVVPSARVLGSLARLAALALSLGVLGGARLVRAQAAASTAETTTGAAADPPGSPSASTGSTTPSSTTPDSATPTGDEAARPTVLVLVGGGSDASAAFADVALERAAVRLRHEGFRVTTAIDLSGRVPPSRLSPTSVGGAEALRAELGYGEVVLVSLFGDASGVSELALATSDGSHRYRASATQTDVPAGEPWGVMLDRAIDRIFAAQRAALMNDPGSALSAEVSAPPVRDASREAAPGATAPPTTTSPAPRSDFISEFFRVVGPGLVAAVGAAAIGLGVYAALDGECTLRGPTTGVCLRGEAGNPGVGAVFIVGGVAAVTASIAWWIGGGSQDDAAGPRIDVVMLTGQQP